jgi:RNA polymerase sigma-70 factor (ECF subfamily)
MGPMDSRSDEELVRAARRDSQAFGAFYDRHAHAVAGWFLRRTRSGELAADLTAETFADALQNCRRYDPERGAAVAWLFGIARRELVQAIERGQVENRARRRLRLPRLELDDEALERVVELAGSAATASRIAALMAQLPADQRRAIEARVIDEDDYAAIAARVRVSESVVRKRVSRGLAELRGRLEEEPS